MLFGDMMKNLRETANMTQAALGSLIGVSDRVVGYYEANNRFPKKQETLRKISEVFNVSVDYLVGTDGRFIQKVDEQYGYPGKRQAQEILSDVKALFAGGELPEADKDDFFRTVTEMYFEAKKSNKKYGRKKLKH